MADSESSDAEVRASRLLNVLLVFLGGALGSAGRYGVTLAFGPDESTWATWVVNMIGAFGFGIVVGVLALSRLDAPSKWRWQLFLCVGLFGGLTSYSAIAFVMAAQTLESSMSMALAYGFVTLLSGGLFTALGLIGGLKLVQLKSRAAPESGEER